MKIGDRIYVRGYVDEIGEDGVSVIVRNDVGYFETDESEIVVANNLDEHVNVRHGKWIKLDMHAHLADHKCTACGQECYVPTCMGEPMYTYCPNCGSRNMEDE